MTSHTIRPELAEHAVPLSDVRPYGRNPRRGNVTAIARSLAEFGQYRPIVVNRATGEVLAGNHTYAAAAELGWERIAVTYVDADEVTAQRIVLADNRIADLGDYDKDLLAVLLSHQVALDEEMVRVLGYSADDVDQLLASTAPPAAFPTYGEDVDTDYQCPKCAYRWSGAPQ